MRSDQAWVKETGNGLSWDRQRRIRTRGFPGGARAPEAHVDNGRTSALGHLGPRLWPLHMGRSRSGELQRGEPQVGGCDANRVLRARGPLEPPWLDRGLVLGLRRT